MRTEISIPRPVSEAAEKMAQKLGISLSDLYTTALTTYVMTHQKHEVTKQLDQVYECEESSIEPLLVGLQIASLGDERW
jgi:predicted RecB family endonuclease